jgi:hypothetical protein
MMSALECYQEYLALKNHFSKPSYDYFKYNGKVRVNAKTFDARKDKLFFQKLAKHPDVHSFLIANLSENEKTWIKELAYSEVAEKVYKDWSKRQQSLSYVFKQDLTKLDPVLKNNFNCKEGEHPLLLRLYLGKEISLETLCLLLEFSGVKQKWDSRMEYDLVWESLKTKIEKYTPFIKYDKDKIVKIALDFFDE